MQCYQYLAATVAVANTIEKIPGIRHRLPLSVIADWMDENGIEADDVLFATPDAIGTQIETRVQQNQPCILRAA